MKIRVVSDLHLEFSDIDLPNDDGVDVLILSGDIMIAEDLHDHKIGLDAGVLDHPDFQGLGRRQAAAIRYRNFLRRVSQQYSDVIYIAGNHEFYHGKWMKTLDYLREECKECASYSNIHFLESDCVKIGDVTFVGGTLWTDLNKGDPLTLHAVRDMMNDFKLIRDDRLGFTKLKPVETAARHRRTLEYIRQVVLNVRERQDPKERIVVVGHHTPSHLSCHPMYSNDYLMNGAYHSDLSEFILDHPEIVLWTHGHTHHPFDYMIGDTRVVCNPRGYETEAHSEHTGWNPNLIIEI
jgi:predicted phosphodiesterase